MRPLPVATDPVTLIMAQPTEALRPFITAYYASEIDSPTPITDYSVPEWGGIRIVETGGLHVAEAGGEDRHFTAPYVQGPSSRTFKFSVSACALVGIGLSPAGLARFWPDLDVSTLANASMPLGQLMGEGTAAFVDAIIAAPTPADKFAVIDAVFSGLLAAARPTQAASLVSELHALLNDPAVSRIEDIADRLKLTNRAVSTLCKRRFGFAPKLLLRRQRFLRMLEMLHARPYGEWPQFVDPQYSDQSHMIREFRYFMGMSPGQYLALPRLVQQMSASHRTRTVGRALQGLE